MNHQTTLIKMIKEVMAARDMSLLQASGIVLNLVGEASEAIHTEYKTTGRVARS